MVGFLTINFMIHWKICGLRKCVVYTNEVVCEICITNNVMSSLCSPRLHPLWLEPSATQRYRCKGLVDEPFRRSIEARISPSKNRTKSYTLRTKAQSHLQNPKGALSEVSLWLIQPAGQSQLN